MGSICLATSANSATTELLIIYSSSCFVPDLDNIGCRLILNSYLTGKFGGSNTSLNSLNGFSFVSSAAEVSQTANPSPYDAWSTGKTSVHHSL